MHVLHIIVSEKSASRPLFTLSATPYGRPGSVRPWKGWRCGQIVPGIHQRLQ